MATAPAIPVSPPKAAESAIGERRFVLTNVGWSRYEALLELFGDDAPRMNYAHGDIELMAPMARHEGGKKLIGFMIEAIAEELDIRCKPYGSTTFKSQLADRGLEPDECYYFASIDRLRGNDRIDLAVEPPPDLCIEVEITSSLLDKLDIYAGLGIPEVWRYEGEAITILLLGPDGRYVGSEKSASLPFIPMGELQRFLMEHDLRHETTWRRRFRAWVRDVLAPIHRDHQAER